MLHTVMSTTSIMGRSFEKKLFDCKAMSNDKHSKNIIKSWAGEKLKQQKIRVN